MANGSPLPEGFVLEQPAARQTTVALPEGFVLEQTEIVAPEGQETAMAQAQGAGIGQQAANIGLELISAINRGAVNLAEYLTTDQINNILALSGSESRVPKFEETEFGRGATAGEFMEPGLARTAIRTGGEMVAPGAAAGGALRGAAQALPKVTPTIETMGQGILKQLGTGTAAGDIGYSILAGMGSEVGREVGGEPGALVGAVVAPTAPGAIRAAGRGLKDLTASTFRSLTRSLEDMSDEGAATLLAEQMIREGIGPDDVVQRLQQLGPEAIPADAGVGFARLLRLASNKVPRIEGQAANLLKARQAGQTDRLLSAFDDASGTASLSVDDEITRLNQVMKPKINRLYDEVRATDVQLSPKLRTLLEGKSSLGRAQRRAQSRLADKRAAGDEITNIDMIDATKQELDDQIGRALRQGENNRARDLIRLKNIMVGEADKAIPQYKEARNLFAGKAAMENAADSGQQFLKMKPRDVQELTRSFGESEKRMFKLGAKRAIMDKVDDLQTNADAVKRLFGKRGDLQKIRHLFDNNAAFNRFVNTLNREADFILTRNAAQANSTTAKQLADETEAINILRETTEAISSPLGASRLLGRITRGLTNKRGSEAHTQALEKAGDILLAKNIDPERITKILMRGNAKQVEAELRRTLRKELKAPRTAPVTTAAAIESQRETPE